MSISYAVFCLKKKKKKKSVRTHKIKKYTCLKMSTLAPVLKSCHCYPPHTPPPFLVSSNLYATFSPFLFFFNDPATTEIYTLSLHDALPISSPTAPRPRPPHCSEASFILINYPGLTRSRTRRSEEHTSELQSHVNLVCRLLLEKKKKKKKREDAQDKKIYMSENEHASTSTEVVSLLSSTHTTTFSCVL